MKSSDTWVVRLALGCIVLLGLRALMYWHVGIKRAVRPRVSPSSEDAAHAVIMQSHVVWHSCTGTSCAAANQPPKEVVEQWQAHAGKFRLSGRPMHISSITYVGGALGWATACEDEHLGLPVPTLHRAEFAPQPASAPAASASANSINVVIFSDCPLTSGLPTTGISTTATSTPSTPTFRATSTAADTDTYTSTSSTSASTSTSAALSVYTFYDGVLACAQELTQAHPHSVVVWEVPGRVLQLKGLDLLLHQHLIQTHLHRNGILVVQPALPLTTQALHCAGGKNAFLSDGGGSGSSGGSSGSRGSGGTPTIMKLVHLLTQQMGFIQASKNLGEVHPREEVQLVQMQRRMGGHRLCPLGDRRESTPAPTSSSLSGPKSSSAPAPCSLQRLCGPLLLTRRYEALCHPPSALTHPLLVTGLGGAGTHYVARELELRGWLVQHESLDADGSVSWLYAVNDRAVGLPYPYGPLSPHSHPRFGLVLHLVRSPWSQISSFSGHHRRSKDFVMAAQRLFPETGRFEEAYALSQVCLRGDPCSLHFAALTWLHWNRFVHSYADATFRVDDGQQLVQYVCNAAQADTPVGALLRRDKHTCPVRACPFARSLPNPDTQTPDSPDTPDSPYTPYIRHRDNPGLLSRALSSALYFARSVITGHLSSPCVIGRRRHHLQQRTHMQFNHSHVATVDPSLAQAILQDAQKYGFPLNSLVP